MLSRPVHTATSETMTVQGTLTRFSFLLLMVMTGSFFCWNAYYGGQDITSYLLMGGIGGLVLALLIVFRPLWASFLAPAYALLEGLLVGGLSAWYHHAYAQQAPFIVMQAVLLTFGTAIAMLILYRFRVIKATERFRSVVITATMGIFLFYLAAFILGFFQIQIPFLHEGGTIGILVSLIVVVVAALNLILDFDRIEQGVSYGLPRRMEWYGAFGLLVTIIWLYIEMLRLLSKINGRS